MYALFRNETTVYKNMEPDTDTAIAGIVCNCWNSIELQRLNELCRRKQAKSKCGPKHHRGWKTIRVFVSSTFTDMHSEREILVKQVFPALREWCEEHKFMLIDCDLRWGVPKDSPSQTTICTCLEELDRCHEDNEELPFFINILGERYGWIPDATEIPEDIREKYQWIPHLSITHMEILHGAYRFQNPNALFCLRDPSFVDDLPQNHLAKFVDTEPLNQCHLKILKAKLLQQFSEQTFTYQCHVDGVDVSTGREKVNLTGLEEFGEKVLSFFKQAIERQYPDHQLAPELSAEELEENAHQMALQTKSLFVFGRASELDTLADYVTSGAVSPDLTETVETDEQREKRETSLRQDCEKFGVSVTDSRILAVVGSAGVGKSALLAKLADHAISTAGDNLMYHQVGASFDSFKPESIIRRLLLALKSASDSGSEEKKEEGQKESAVDAIRLMRDVVRLAGQCNQQLTIIVDGLDELDENNLPRFLDWLPPRLPRNVRCIVSCRSSHRPCMARLESRQAYFYTVDELSVAGVVDVVSHYLSSFNKRLDSDQMASVLKHKSARLPVWLGVVCEEMRVFGDFATLSAKIEHFSDDLVELFKQVLSRLLREDETQQLESILSLMYCSKLGLPEKSILQLLGNLDSKEEAPAVVWATCRRYLKPFIRVMMNGYTSLVRPAVSQFNEAVKQIVVQDKEKLVKWHTHLANFYEYHCKDNWQVTENLPYHLLNSNLWQRLKSFYRSDFRTFNSSQWRRHEDMNAIRCQRHVFPQRAPRAIVCHFCSTRSGTLFPGHRTLRDTCAVCGSLVVALGKPAAEAVLCQFHAHGGSPHFANCLTCGRVVGVANAPQSTFEKLNLCHSCSAGFTGSNCCFLLDGT